MKKILQIIGINTFIAIKKWYNECNGHTDFYKMLNRRLSVYSPKELAYNLRAELLIHFKEVAQYQ